MKFKVTYDTGTNKVYICTSTKQNFLGGVFVHQVLYWTWLKLEMDETKVEKNGEN
jgi:hypothetical protein